MTTTLARIRRELAVDPETEERWLASEREAPQALPPTWTPEHVGARLVEAFETLRAMPANVWPKEFGSAWPDYRPEWADLLAQAELPPAEIIERRNEQNRVRVRPSAEKVSRMEEALRWPARFLDRQPGASRVVVTWALTRAQRRSIRRLCRERGWVNATFKRRRNHGLSLIASELNRLCVQVS